MNGPRTQQHSDSFDCSLQKSKKSLLVRTLGHVTTRFLVSVLGSFSSQPLLAPGQLLRPDYMMLSLVEGVRSSERCDAAFCSSDANRR